MAKESGIAKSIGDQDEDDMNEGITCPIIT